MERGLAGDPSNNPESSFTAIDQEVAVPTEPAELVQMVVAGEWDAAIAYVRSEYVDLVCNHFQIEPGSIGLFRLD
jgi:hypothetical protein